MPTPTAPQTNRDHGGEARAEQRRLRRQSFLGLFDPTRGRGLEIGPLDIPIGDTRTDDVKYVDVQDRDGIVEHYRDDQNVVLENIPEIDYWLIHGDRTLGLAEAVAPGAPYDWVFASHVIEHVPDVIGWLAEIAKVTAPDARIILAVPDRRYCFDRLRPPSTVGQLIAAHEAGATIPDVRAVYDYFASAVGVDTAALHDGARPPGRDRRIHGPHYAYDQLERVRSGEYVDAHVWLFTPSTLVEQIRELRELGLADWYVEAIDVPAGGLEFHAVLRRVPLDGGDVPEVPPQSDLPDWLDDEWTTADELRAARRESRRLQRRVATLEAQVSALHTSTSWRIGQAVVRPLRRLRTAVGRLVGRLGRR